MDVQELISSKAVFYGIRLEKDDPYLERNLARLEIRFRERYQASLEKEEKRKEQGKPPHKTVVQSVDENRQRLETVRLLRAFLSEN